MRYIFVLMVQEARPRCKNSVIQERHANQSLLLWGQYVEAILATAQAQGQLALTAFLLAAEFSPTACIDAQQVAHRSWWKSAQQSLLASRMLWAQLVDRMNAIVLRRVSFVEMRSRLCAT